MVHTDPGALLLSDRAANYSLETLVTLLGALHANLQAALADPNSGLADAKPLAQSAPPSFPFQVSDTPETGGPGSKKDNKA